MTTTTSDNPITTIFQAAADGAILVDRGDLGMLKFTGQTRLDLINRMSTQKVDALGSGEGAATILTTDIGRIIDRLILYAGSDAVYALTGENNAEAIARYLMGYVFFNDDFQVEDLTDETAVFGVYGARAGQLLAEAGFGDIDLPRHHWRQVQLDDAVAYLHRTDPIAGNGYFVTADADDADTVRRRLLDAGIVPAGPDAFDALRIAEGAPRFGREMTLDYIPLETGLWDDVSFHKGCYTGQEIIARMESRGKLAKRLVRLRADAPVSPGATISADGRNAGTITSAAVGPDGPIALGYVRTAVLNAGERLDVAGTAVIPLDNGKR